LHTVLKAKSLAGDFHNVSVVGQPVEESCGKSFIAEKLDPICELKVGGDDHGSSLFSNTCTCAIFSPASTEIPVTIAFTPYYAR
jgi:hypothetical protein